MVLIVKDVTKKFGKKLILDSINVRFETNKIYGIVGENGSGKTVLLKLISGLYRVSGGSIEYQGEKLKKDIDFIPSLGIIIENPGFFNDLSAFENLKILASINNVVSDDVLVKVLKQVNLKNDNKKVGDFSLGMRQRLGIAQAIMEDPKVLILDEFSTGLDSQGVDLVHEIITSMKNENRVIIITSHSEYDIQNLCDVIYAIRDGHLYEKV